MTAAASDRSSTQEWLVPGLPADAEISISRAPEPPPAPPPPAPPSAMNVPPGPLQGDHAGRSSSEIGAVAAEAAELAELAAERVGRAIDRLDRRLAEFAIRIEAVEERIDEPPAAEPGPAGPPNDELLAGFFERADRVERCLRSLLAAA